MQSVGKADGENGSAQQVSARCWIGIGEPVMSEHIHPYVGMHLEVWPSEREGFDVTPGEFCLGFVTKVHTPEKVNAIVFGANAQPRPLGDIPYYGGPVSGLTFTHAKPSKKS
jgi:hypothetical protein